MIAMPTNYWGSEATTYSGYPTDSTNDTTAYYEWYTPDPPETEVVYCRSCESETTHDVVNERYRICSECSYLLDLGTSPEVPSVTPTDDHLYDLDLLPPRRRQPKRIGLLPRPPPHLYPRLESFLFLYSFGEKNEDWIVSCCSAHCGNCHG